MQALFRKRRSLLDQLEVTDDVHQVVEGHREGRGGADGGVKRLPKSGGTVLGVGRQRAGDIHHRKVFVQVGERRGAHARAAAGEAAGKSR